MQERELRLAGTPQSVTRARQHVTELCRGWGMREVRDVAVLLTSEAVTNAVLHAGGDVLLSVRRHGEALHVEVVDGSPAQPTMRRAGHSDESGRGLGLVNALSTAWGTRPDGVGKAVWFEVGRS
jgi:anti-sigma regulatory factor (Ser/Thr protein kinase)